MDYFEEAKSIWKEFVPKSGQAETLQGELLRAVEKLRDESHRNGNRNWDNGFKTLSSFLQTNLCDKAIFSKERIRQIKQSLKLISKSKQPCLDDDPYDFLGERVVDFYKHYGSKAHVINPNLLR